MEYRKIEEIEIENMNTSFSKRDTSNWLPSSRNEFPHNVHGTSYSLEIRFSFSIITTIKEWHAKKAISGYR